MPRGTKTTKTVTKPTLLGPPDPTCKKWLPSSLRWIIEVAGPIEAQKVSLTSYKKEQPWNHDIVDHTLHRSPAKSCWAWHPMNRTHTSHSGCSNSLDYRTSTVLLDGASILSLEEHSSRGRVSSTGAHKASNQESSSTGRTNMDIWLISVEKHKGVSCVCKRSWHQWVAFEKTWTNSNLMQFDAIRYNSMQFDAIRITWPAQLAREDQVKALALLCRAVDVDAQVRRLATSLTGTRGATKACDMCPKLLPWLNAPLSKVECRKMVERWWKSMPTD